MSLSPGVTLAVQIALSAFLILLAAWDWRTGNLPNWGTLPLMAVGLGWLIYRVAVGVVPVAALVQVLVAWVFVYGAWVMFRPILEGDAKLAMGLLALFPDERFLWILLATIGLGSLVLLALEPQGRGLRRFGGLLFTVFVSRTFPKAAEVEAELAQPGRAARVGFLFSLAGMIYMWWPH